MSVGQYTSFSGEEFIWEMQILPGSSLGSVSSGQVELDNEEFCCHVPCGDALDGAPSLSASAEDTWTTPRPYP